MVSAWQISVSVPLITTRSKQDKVSLILDACRSIKVFMEVIRPDGPGYFYASYRNDGWGGLFRKYDRQEQGISQ